MNMVMSIKGKEPMIYVIKSYKGKMKIFWDPSYYCNG